MFFKVICYCPFVGILTDTPHKQFICILVVQLLITELATVRIRTGDYANENSLYLVKAYLGILHTWLDFAPIVGNFSVLPMPWKF